MVPVMAAVVGVGHIGKVELSFVLMGSIQFRHAIVCVQTTEQGELHLPYSPDKTALLEGGARLHRPIAAMCSLQTLYFFSNSHFNILMFDLITCYQKIS